MDSFNVVLDPCTQTATPAACQSHAKKLRTDTTTRRGRRRRACAAQSNIRTAGKFAFKYGWARSEGVEVKRYEVPAYTFSPTYTNSAIAGNSVLPEMAHNHDRYGSAIVLASFEDKLNYEESEIDLVEYISSAYYIQNHRSIPRRSHQYYNVQHSGSTAMTAIRTEKLIYFCNGPEEDHFDPIILQLPVCRSNKTIVVTKGLEWTPQGFVTYYKVEGDSNPGGMNVSPVPLRKVANRTENRKIEGLGARRRLRRRSRPMAGARGPRHHRH